MSSRHKLSPRVVVAIFIGYPTDVKLLTVYLAKKTNITSYDVAFHEDLFPFHALQKSPLSFLDPFPDLVTPIPLDTPDVPYPIPIPEVPKPTNSPEPISTQPSPIPEIVPFAGPVH